MHELLLANLCEIMEDLELPYRVIANCTGDMGFNKVKMNDVEAWVPSENTYRELGSCSSIGQFQARRTNTRYRGADGDVRFCATLNNTGIAVPRALVPVIENQAATADVGSHENRRKALNKKSGAGRIFFIYFCLEYPVISRR